MIWSWPRVTPQIGLHAINVFAELPSAVNIGRRIMDWDAIGAIAELAAAAAVLVTLIYLAVQVRQSNFAAQRESFRGYISELNQRLLEPQRDPEFVELFQRANRDWNSISLRDQAVVSSVYSSYFFACSEAYALREKGIVDPALEYETDQAVASILQMPGPATWWNLGCTFYSPSFRHHVDQLLASENCPPPIHHLLPWYMDETGGSAKHGT